MLVELKDYTDNPEYKIGLAASECYDSDTSADACFRRAKHCKDSGHLATLRFAFATFRVSGISRICSHQIVRIAHAGILQRSQRYCDESNITFVQPPSLEGMPENLKLAWAMLEQNSKDVYRMARDAGMKKEDARYCFLHSAETSLWLCLNFQGWRDFLKNRTDKAAQWEVRAVANEIQSSLHMLAPSIF